MMMGQLTIPWLRETILRRRYLLGRPLPQPAGPRRTICASARRVSRFSRVHIRYPDWVLRAEPPPAYDLDMAAELLVHSGEFPDDLGGMVILLTEYRYALAALVDAGYAKASRPAA
jgi:hypothetical protein